MKAAANSSASFSTESGPLLTAREQPLNGGNGRSPVYQMNPEIARQVQLN